MNTEYTNIITAIHTSNNEIIDDHTDMVIDNFKAVVLLNNGKVGLLTKTQNQCINEAYVDALGTCHLSMASISGNITGVDTDIFKAVSDYNRSYKKKPARQIIAMHVVI